MTLTQIDYLMKLIRSEAWFPKYEEGLDLYESVSQMTLQQYKKCLSLMYNEKPDTEAFIKQFFIYGV